MMYRSILLTVVLMAFPLAVPAGQLDLIFDPDATNISFTLGATLHKVHGSFRLQHGSARYDPATGEVSGELVVNARSGHSGNEKRDRDMHRKVLESESFPTIVFVPERIDGTIPGSGETTVTVAGTFRLHGVEHPVQIPLTVELDGDRAHVTAQLEVPYVEWGLRNPSKLLLRVAKVVTIEVDARATITSYSD